MRKINEIKTRNDLADLLNIPRKKLTYILYVKGVDNLYKSFDIPKKNGGHRHICAPEKNLKFIQRSIAEILSNYQKKTCEKYNINPNISHAFQKGKSFITNAQIHKNKRYVINIDLENFFDSFHFGRVRGYFFKNRNFQLPLEIATILAQLTCYHGRLPQGSPSSPVITNLICNILDIRIYKLAKKYKLNYTRYVDDLTFSTNDKNFYKVKKEFFQKLEKEITRAGFSINQNKTQIQYRNSRQEVTGIVVNKKLHVNKDYYKKTRAMAHQLYISGAFFIEEGQPGTINQLEGRFSFINQLECYNYEHSKDKHFKDSEKFYHLNGREREYSRFIFYKYFFANPKPLIVTEGKTDIRYIKAALEKMWTEYPHLISKNSEDQFDYHISFLHRTKRLKPFINLAQDGADSMQNIYNLFIGKNTGKNNHPNYLMYFINLCQTTPLNPVILLFDNEKTNEKPLPKFINYFKKINKSNKSEQKNKLAKLRSNNWTNLVQNLYLLTIPSSNNNKTDTDIECLFREEDFPTLNGKTFCKENDCDQNIHYGKEIFSKYVKKNYSKINFDRFIPLLNNISNIIEDYKNK
jgi:RNA-directed DNA polymerase